MGFLSGLFRARDAPQNRTSGSAYSFFMGGSTNDLTLAVADDLRIGISPKEQVRHQRFPEHEGSHLRVQRIVQGEGRPSEQDFRQRLQLFHGRQHQREACQ